MAYLKPPLTENDVKKLTISKLRLAYLEISKYYNRILNNEVVYCHKCNDHRSAKEAFYEDKKFASGYYPICKKCILDMVEKRDKNGISHETKESVMTVLRMMDLPYIDSLYESMRKKTTDSTADQKVSSPFMAYMRVVKSLPNYRGMTFDNSEFAPSEALSNEQSEIDMEIARKGKRRFGRGYTDEEYIKLEEEYQDWVNRYACENKVQEFLFQRICVLSLKIEKVQRQGGDTKDLDKSIQDIFQTLGIKPTQSNSNALTEAKTFGQLIQKWENEKPIPEPEDEFKDVDNIGLYIDVFFKGHMAKMMGIQSAMSALYDKYIRKYTVKRETEETGGYDSEAMFNKIFGKKIDEGEL